MRGPVWRGSNWRGPQRPTQEVMKARVCGLPAQDGVIQQETVTRCVGVSAHHLQPLVI